MYESVVFELQNDNAKETNMFILIGETRYFSRAPPIYRRVFRVGPGHSIADLYMSARQEMRPFIYSVACYPTCTSSPDEWKAVCLGVQPNISPDNVIDKLDTFLLKNSINR